MKNVLEMAEIYQAKKLVVPASVTLTGKHLALVQRTQTQINVQGLSFQQKFAACAELLGQIADIDTVIAETVQRAEELIEQNVKVSLDFYEQMHPMLAPARESRDVYDLIIPALGVETGHIRALRAAIPNAATGKYDFATMFWMLEGLFIEHDGVVHQFDVDGKGKYHYVGTQGSSAGSQVTKAQAERVVSLFLGALQTITTVDHGHRRGLPKFTKPLRNQGTLVGKNLGYKAPGTNNWRCVHFRRAHYLTLRNGKIKLIPGKLINGGRCARSTTLTDGLRDTRPTGSVMTDIGGK